MSRTLKPSVICKDGKQVVAFSEGDVPAFLIDLEQLARVLYPYMKQAAREVERDSRDYG